MDYVRELSHSEAKRSYRRIPAMDRQLYLRRTRAKEHHRHFRIISRIPIQTNTGILPRNRSRPPFRSSRFAGVPPHLFAHLGKREKLWQLFAVHPAYAYRPPIDVDTRNEVELRTASDPEAPLHGKADTLRPQDRPHRPYAACLPSVRFRSGCGMERKRETEVPLPAGRRQHSQ